MYTRVAQATIKPKRLAEFKHGIANHVLPAIRTQEGLVDAIEMYSGNDFMCVTIWRTEQDAERYTHELFPRIVARHEPLVDGILREQTFKLAYNSIRQAESENVQKMESVPARKMAVAA